jgi:hypothetical protein
VKSAIGWKWPEKARLLFSLPLHSVKNRCSVESLIFTNADSRKPKMLEIHAKTKTYGALARDDVTSLFTTYSVESTT